MDYSSSHGSLHVSQVVIVYLDVPVDSSLSSEDCFLFYSFRYLDEEKLDLFTIDELISCLHANHFRGTRPKSKLIDRILDYYDAGKLKIHPCSTNLWNKSKYWSYHIKQSNEKRAYTIDVTEENEGNEAVEIKHVDNTKCPITLEDIEGSRDKIRARCGHMYTLRGFEYILNKESLKNQCAICNQIILEL